MESQNPPPLLIPHQSQDHNLLDPFSVSKKKKAQPLKKFMHWSMKGWPQSQNWSTLDKSQISTYAQQLQNSKPLELLFYCIDTSVLLENTPLVKFIRNYIRNSSGIFSISLLMKILMISLISSLSLTLFLNSLVYDPNFYGSSSKYLTAALTREIHVLFLPLEHKVHIFSPPCDILLYIQYLLKVFTY